MTQFTTYNRDKADSLREAGYHIYGIRDIGGNGYTIEPHVLVDNIGHVVTDFDLEKYMHAPKFGKWIDDVEFSELGAEEVCLSEFLH